MLASRVEVVVRKFVTVSLAAAICLPACAQTAPRGSVTADASATPAATAVPTSSPLPIPGVEPLLAESAQAMQKVASVKQLSTRGGSQRGLDAQQQLRITEIAERRGINLAQTSPGHAADATRGSADSVDASTKTRMRVESVIVGASYYERRVEVDDTGNVTRTVSDWSLRSVTFVEQGVQVPSYLFPGSGFGVFSPPASLKAVAPAIERATTASGGAAWKVSVTIVLDGSSHQQLAGIDSYAVWISTDSLLWDRTERSTRYADGGVWTEITDYREYNVPNAISLPGPSATPRAPVAVVTPGPAGTGGVIVRVCRGSACAEGAEGVPGVTVSLSGSGISQSRITDTRGVAIFEGLAPSGSHSFTLSCSGRTYSIGPGFIRAGDRVGYNIERACP